jgi:hypothetical protein
VLGATDWQHVPTAHDPGPQPTIAATAISARMAFDGTGMLLVGDGDTWRFDGVDWTRLALRPPCLSPAFVQTLHWFSGSGETLLLETDSQGNGFFTGRAFGWNGSAWREAATSGAMPQRVDFGIADDPAHGSLVLFGGWAPSGLLGDTWTLVGSTWMQQHPTQSPSPRMFATMATDMNRGGVLLFGGWSPALADTWSWDGANWSLSAVSGPPARMWAGAASVPSSGHVLMFGGYSQPGATLDDTWEWNGAQWTARGTTNFYSTWVHSMDFDTTLQRAVAVGTFSLGSGNHGVISWNGNAWVPADPPGAGGVFVASDPYRGRTMVGSTTPQFLSLLTPTPAATLRVGSGCAAGPPPVLDALEQPRLGEPAFALEVATGAPNAPTLFALGLGANNLALGNGCTLLVAQTFAPLGAVANAAGISTLPLPVPSLPILRGIGMRVQAAVADPARGAFGGFTLTNGLLLRPGD